MALASRVVLKKDTPHVTGLTQRKGATYLPETAGLREVCRKHWEAWRLDLDLPYVSFCLIMDQTNIKGNPGMTRPCGGLGASPRSL